MAREKQIGIMVDNVNINATHFSKMKKEEAIKAMELDGILKVHCKDAAWAEKAHEACCKAVADELKPVTLKSKKK